MNDTIFQDMVMPIPQKDYFSKKLQHFTNRKEDFFSIVFLNIDNFKKINDSFGYEVGDELILEIIIKIKKELRNGEEIFVCGTDKFIIVLPSLEQKYIIHKAETIIKLINKRYKIRKNVFQVFGRIGISSYPEDGYNFHDIVRKASMAMEFIESNDMNKYIFFNKYMMDIIEGKTTMESDLRTAIQNNQFILYYQPLVSIKDKEVIGAEALIRWNHPVKGMVSPIEFIPLAEETGLINDIGEWVIKDAFKQSKIWQEKGYDKLKVSINISAIQLRYYRFLNCIKETLNKVRNNPKNIKIEITETVMMDSYEQGIKIINDLNELGIDTILDDFGVGHSSLSHLKTLPISTLKIDKSFIDNIHREKWDKEIVQGIVNLGHKMKMSVVAEGVEFSEQLDVLEDIGCDAVQGYVLGRPMEPWCIEKLLRRREQKNV